MSPAELANIQETGCAIATPAAAVKFLDKQIRGADLVSVMGPISSVICAELARSCIR